MNIKKIIREEMDDMWQDLVKDEPNIWLSYQMILFDEPPTKEDVVNLIRDAFKSGLVSDDAIGSWEDEGVEKEVKTIVKMSKVKGRSPYLRLNDKWLYYGTYYNDYIEDFSEMRKIKYSEAKKYINKEVDSYVSQIFNKNITETNDFEWTNDISLIEPRKGDEIKVHNIGDENAFIEWLGYYANKYKGGVYGNVITGVVNRDNYDGSFIIEEKQTGDEIYFPHYTTMSLEGLDLSYEITNGLY